MKDYGNGCLGREIRIMIYRDIILGEIKFLLVTCTTIFIEEIYKY